MLIQILGPGCPNCKQLHKNAIAAVTETHLDVNVEKVEDMATIVKFGILSTPALVIDGTVKATGKVLTVHEIKKLIG